MKFSSASVPLALLSASTAWAAGTLEFSLESKQVSHPPRLTKRDVNGTSEAALFSRFGGTLGQRFVVNLTVGTPPQPQSILIDTGSSDTIFLSAESFCTTPKTRSDCPGGTYNTSASSTFEMITPGGISAYYGGGNISDATSHLVADLVADVVQTGDLIVHGVHFGSANQSSTGLLNGGAYTGLMGLGYSDTEQIKQGQPKYPTFVESLVEAGAIASRVFSLYLNELSSYGSILFGGLDTEKYTGNLTTLNLNPVRFNATDVFRVATYNLWVDEISATHEDGTQEALLESDQDSLDILADSGTTTWNLPLSIYNKVVNISGAVNSSAADQPILPCSEISNKTSFAITLSGNGTNTAQIEVSLSSLFIPAVAVDGSGIVKQGTEDICVLMVQPVAPNARNNIFGAPVMRAAYWVFDMDNGQVSVAQARLSTTASNVVAIEAGPRGVMNAAKQPSALGANQTETVDGNATASVSVSLATATNTVGQASGPQPTEVGSGAAGQITDVTFRASLASALMLSVTFAALML